jgi:hypothetical protein
VDDPLKVELTCCCGARLYVAGNPKVVGECLDEFTRMHHEHNEAWSSTRPTLADYKRDWAAHLDGTVR